MQNIDFFIDTCESLKIPSIVTEGANMTALELSMEAINDAKDYTLDALRYKASKNSYAAREAMDKALKALEDAKYEIHHLPPSVSSMILGNIWDELGEIAGYVGADVVARIAKSDKLKKTNKFSRKLSQFEDAATMAARLIYDYNNDDVNINNFNQYINSILNDLDKIIIACKLMRKVM